MIAICKRGGEIEDIEKGSGRNRIPAFKPHTNSIESAQALLDDAVLVFEDVKWFRHRWSPEREVFSSRQYISAASLSAAQAEVGAALKRL
jgi:hypothetical protein